jgi:hypothetical protein
MKLVLATALAFGLSGGIALAAGCSSHGTDAAMSCEAGKTWDEKTKSCIDASA